MPVPQQWWWFFIGRVGVSRNALSRPFFLFQALTWDPLVCTCPVTRGMRGAGPHAAARKSLCVLVRVLLGLRPWWRGLHCELVWGEPLNFWVGQSLTCYQNQPHVWKHLEILETTLMRLRIWCVYFHFRCNMRICMCQKILTEYKKTICVYKTILVSPTFVFIILHSQRLWLSIAVKFRANQKLSFSDYICNLWTFVSLAARKFSYNSQKECETSRRGTLHVYFTCIL